MHIEGLAHAWHVMRAPSMGVRTMFHQIVEAGNWRMHCILLVVKHTVISERFKWGGEYLTLHIIMYMSYITYSVITHRKLWNAKRHTHLSVNFSIHLCSILSLSLSCFGSILMFFH